MIITNTGRTRIRDIILGLATPFQTSNTYGAAGANWDDASSSTFGTHSATSTALYEEIHDATYPRPQVSTISKPINYGIKMSVSFKDANLPPSGTDNNKKVREMGIFDNAAANSGNLLFVGDFLPIEKESGADIYLSLEVKIE